MVTGARLAEAAQASERNTVTRPTAPAGPLAAQVLALQRSAGNRAVAKLARSGALCAEVRRAGVRGLMRDPPSGAAPSAGGASPATTGGGGAPSAAVGTPGSGTGTQAVVTGGGTVAGIANAPQLTQPSIETGSTPSPSSLYQGSTINNAGTFTLNGSLSGVGSRSPLLAGPLTLNGQLTYSPLSWLQTQITGGSTGVAGQAQFSLPTPRLINPSLQLNAAMTPGGNGQDPTALIPSLSAIAIGELLGGGDPQHPTYVLGANAGLLWTPYASGALSGARGYSGALSATWLPLGYYNDAPRNAYTDSRPGEPTGAARLAFGAAANFSQLFGSLQSDPSARGTLSSLGIDAFATWTSPVLSAPSTAPVRFFMSINTGPRWMWLPQGPPGSTVGFGWSAGFTTGLLFGTPPPPPSPPIGSD